MKPDVSVVLSTRNRAAFLPEALRSYERITSAIPWELVVVDNGSTDSTQLVLQEFSAATTVTIRTVVEPAKGLSRARNTGWRHARGDVVAFTDDDCYPSPDYIDQVRTVFADPSIDYFGGRILLHDPEDYPITILLRDTRDIIPPKTFVAAGFIQGANMGARRRVLETVQGFDEALGAGTPFPSEDIDFITRASFAEFQGAYDPRPVVYHHHRRRSREAVRALKRAYSIGRGAYYMKCIFERERRRAALRDKYYNHSPASLFRHGREALYEVFGGVAYLVHRAAAKLGVRR